MNKKKINRVIDLLLIDQPVYYTSTNNFTYENGKKMAKTWADYIRLDCEHGPLDIKGVNDFMNGLFDAGPTKTGHLTPAVIAELPFGGTSEMVVESNAWMINQLLACGIHGLILCHAENPDAVRKLIEFVRYPFHTSGVGKNLNLGRRGHGGQKRSAKMWGISVEEYFQKADVWPLNPNGEIILGIKIENKLALKNAVQTAKVPGITFGEWGMGDMLISHGYPKTSEFPLSDKFEKIRQYVWDACNDAGIYFLCILTQDNIKEMLDKGVKFCRTNHQEIAEIGRDYTKRPLSW